MDGDGEEKPARRPRRPVAATAAIVASGAAILGYSGYVLPTALHVYRYCTPVRGAPCLDHSFWGFDPTLFLLAAFVGLSAGAAIVALGVLLWFLPKHHEMIGVLVLSASTASIVAYGGAFVGIAAGVAGGVLAIQFRPQRFHELARWGGPRATRRPDEPANGNGTPPNAPPPPLSPEAYAPLPKVWRPYAVVSPTAPPSASGSTLPRFGSIAEALASQRPASPLNPPPAPTASRPPPPQPNPGARGTSASKPALPRAPSPVEPMRSKTPGAPVAPVPIARPAPSAPTPPETVVPPSGGRARAWKCSNCGLTNAPWSKSCTRCHSAAPTPPA